MMPLSPVGPASLPIPQPESDPEFDTASLQAFAARNRARSYATANAAERSKRPQAAIGSTAAGNKGLGGVTMMPNTASPGFAGYGGTTGGHGRQQSQGRTKAKIDARLPSTSPAPDAASDTSAPNPAVTGLPVPEDETLEGFVSRQMKLAGPQANGVYSSGPYRGLTQGQAMEKAKALGMQLGKKSVDPTTGQPPQSAPAPAPVTSTPAMPMTQMGVMPPAMGMVDGQPAKQFFEDAANRQQRPNLYAKP